MRLQVDIALTTQTLVSEPYMIFVPLNILNIKNLRTQTLVDLPQRCFVSTGACGWSPCHGPQCWRYRPRLCCSDEMRSYKRTTGCHGGHPPRVSPGQYPLFPHYFIKALIAVKAQNGHLPLLTPIDFYLQQ